MAKDSPEDVEIIPTEVPDGKYEKSKMIKKTLGAPDNGKARNDYGLRGT